MMKYLALIFIGFLLTAFGCNKKPKESITGHLFKFQLTRDKAFCNPDSVVLSECSSGDFYFTEKGNVFYTYFCAGEDSVSYLVGKYFVADSLVTKCSFYQKYSLAVNKNKVNPNGSFEADMNSGFPKKIAPVSIRLNKLRCEKFRYSFISNGRYRLTYVLSEPSKEYADDYFSQFGKINYFRGM